MSKPADFDDADDFYQRLVDAHEALRDEQARRFDLALILMLANHVGDKAALAAYIEQAKTAVTPPEVPPERFELPTN